MWDTQVNNKQCQWVTYGDPIFPQANANNCIVSIYETRKENVVITLTKSGVIAAWDTKNLLQQSFGLKRVPNCITV